eukprot:GILJ01005336.1.p1 GENE.GILJ01005336.1~~GILJ01005336.1.p1  ORF type:complete len:492 (+),score=87.18 GILJ01005336.1:40-1515(+)
MEITPYEAEHLVKSLTPLTVRDVGGSKWIRQHENLDKLNIQAHRNAISRSDEYVMDSFVVMNQLPTLIHDLLLTEVWKEYVFPLVKSHLATMSSLRGYLPLYHEATVCNLLEVCLYHRTACEATGDAMVDLVDYCMRKLVYLNSQPVEALTTIRRSTEEYLKSTPEQELEEQKKEIEFGVCMIAITVVRFISDHTSTLPLSVLHRLLETHDVLASLVPLMDAKPWLRKNAKGQKEKFEDQKWVVLTPDDAGRVCKMEAQVWLAIYNFFMDIECRKKYQLTSYRKGMMLKLRRHMNEVLLDQLPVLTELLRVLEQLSIVDPPANMDMSSFVVEQLPELKDNIMRGQDWPSVAKWQIANVFVESAETRREDLERLAGIYNLNSIDELLEQPRCQVCGRAAANRCSKCKTEWYCGRECQVKAWKQHKPICEAFCATQQAQQQGDQQQQSLVTELPSASASSSSAAVETNATQPQAAASHDDSSKPSKVLIEELD